MRGKTLVHLCCVLLMAAGCGPTVFIEGSCDESSDDGSPPSGPGGNPTTGDDPDPGPDSGVGDTVGDTAGETDSPPLPEPAIPSFSGNAFIDAFFAEEGLIVVEATGVFVISRAGDVLHGYESPRPIESAAFDGEWLGVADQAILTTFDLTLQPQADTTLAEGCRSAAMVSGPRFVCGPENDWDRIFYTYDALSGTLMGTSAPYTYNGTPMRRVPGTDDFVTVTIGLSPSDFHLYTAIEDPVEYINESPYHGDFAATLVHAFVGVPATHVVNSQGIMLRIYGGGCVPGSPFESECFVKDGELGTLPADVYGFVDLREGADGYLYGLVDPDQGFGIDPPCEQTACELQRIDPESRTIVSKVELALTGQEFAMLRPDPSGTGVAVIAGWNAPFTYSFEDIDDYDVFFVAI